MTNAGISNLAATPSARAGPAVNESAAHSEFVRLRDYLASQIIGQDSLIERLLIALLADGHLLVEGPPGLAKTRAIKALAHAVEADFHRLQFTPDLLPADLTGSDIYRPEEGVFRFQRGPLFHNLILADEVNRAPASNAAARTPSADFSCSRLPKNSAGLRSTSSHTGRPRHRPG
jgi:MoxR-like ATPase